MNTDDILKMIKDEYDMLEREAKAIADDFQIWLQEENQKQKASRRSTLTIRVRRRGDYTLSVIWCHVRFFRRRDGGWTPRTREIPSGRNHLYLETRLASYTKGWELKEVMETERRLAKIRKKRNALGKLVRSVKAVARAYEKAEKESQAED